MALALVKSVHLFSYREVDCARVGCHLRKHLQCWVVKEYLFTMVPFIMSVRFKQGYHRIFPDMNLLTDLCFFIAVNMTNLQTITKQSILRWYHNNIFFSFHFHTEKFSKLSQF